MAEQIRTLALFDLDGTLTDRDTFRDLLRFSFGTFRLFAGLLVTLPWTFFYIVGLCSAKTAKERVFRRFFAGMEEEEFVKRTRKYSLERLPALFRPGALDQIRQHKEHGHDTFIVSASIRHWIEPWAASEGVGVIATEVEIRDGTVTGRFSTDNCRGEEKITRILEAIQLSDYGRIYAYGDTPHDQPMLTLATDPVYQPFRREANASIQYP
ncbi:MAG: HAD-IB family hydrolase [Acidobacteria bacterium CG_4_9_14_3_um_filter_49_7]|nr:MAG: HAD-IB family hydrolase [Acidobacteria bacterium CG_4_9_14_3_um_filter_49_7]